MIEFVKKLALSAGALALSDRSHMLAGNIHCKGNVKDLVTDTDRRVENFIVSALKERFPGYGIFGEESGKNDEGCEYCWVIDPIDGTTSFVHGSPNWSVSIALFHHEQPVLGVVYAPVYDELYYAEKGKGAFCNGVKIHVTDIGNIPEAVVAIGFYCLRDNWKEENNLKFLNRIAPNVCDIRKHGSAALDFCFVARGRQEAYWELALQPYDFGAGWVILTEAGGRVSDLYGGDNFPQYGIICSNGVIHDKMLEYFTDYQHLCR